MGRLSTRSVRLHRGHCIAVATAVIFATAALPCIAAASGSMPASTTTPIPGIPKAALDQFRGICSELESARARLANGSLDGHAFADTLLALFTRADSLAQFLAEGSRNNPAWITLQKGMGYLMQSLRENWTGMAGQNGVDFADADVALKAAVAWRSDVAEASP